MTPRPPQRSWRRYHVSRQGNVLASGLWLGPRDSEQPWRYLLVTCPVCGVEQVCESPIRWRDTSAWRVRVVREGQRVRLVTEGLTRPQTVLTTCQHCGHRLDVFLFGRLPEPWPHGAGMVRPMPNLPEASDGEGQP